MLIIGNSHVDIFRQMELRFSKGYKHIKIHWLGSVTIENILESFNGALGSRMIAAAQEDPILLIIGQHDAIELLSYVDEKADLSFYKEQVAKKLDGYSKLFCLMRNRKIAWIEIPCMVVGDKFFHLDQQLVKNLIYEFFDKVKEVCRRHDINVISPLMALTNEEGEFPRKLLQKDLIHLNRAGAYKYICRLEEWLGKSLSISNKLIFEPSSELESYFNLVYGSLRCNKECATNLFSEFIISIHSKVLNLQDRRRILRSDIKISRMPISMYGEMQEYAPSDSNNVKWNYGIFNYWYSLVSYRNKDYEMALVLIEAAQVSSKFRVDEWRVKLLRNHINRKLSNLA